MPLMLDTYHSGLASRGFILHAWGKEKVAPREKISASAIAGAVGGTAGGLIRKYCYAIFKYISNVLYRRTKECDTRRIHVCSIWSNRTVPL